MNLNIPLGPYEHLLGGHAMAIGDMVNSMLEEAFVRGLPPKACIIAALTVAGTLSAADGTSDGEIEQMAKAVIEAARGGPARAGLLLVKR